MDADGAGMADVRVDLLPADWALDWMIWHGAGPAPATLLGAPALPPAGARMGWLDHVMGQHAFVVLLFYRGFW